MEMIDANAILQKYFGYSSFRDGQEEVVSAVLSGRDVLCVMPTGAGKSLCYQVPALTLSGITLVISPLISLMKDQVRSLKSVGVDAAYINSSLTYSQYLRVLQNTADGMYKIIYVAPERLESPDFLNLCAGLSISFIAVDEAHCVSQWGQDFRPSYLEILHFVNYLPVRPVVAAFTATAAEQIRRDIRSLLQLRSPLECVKGFDRPNLYFGVQQPENKKKALLSLIEERREQSGIVYCMSRKAVEDVCQFLLDNGYNATRYHAGLSDAERRLNQDDFLYDRAVVMVATSAFGMGIDKSNVSYVIHYNMPPDLESYYQEAGRAGRDGSAADCILLFSPGDFYTNRSLLSRQEVDADISEEQREFLLERSMKRLSDMFDYGSATDCLRGRILRYFGEEGTCKCGNCSNCLAEMVELDATVDVQKILSCIVRCGEKYAVGTITAVLQGRKSEKLREAKLDLLSVWGIMQEKTPAYIKRVIEYLVSEGILDCIGDFRILKTTPKSRDILRGNKTVIVKLPSDLQIDKSLEKFVKEKKKKASARKTSAANVINASLYEQLRELRTELAAEDKVPPYIIASNALLEEICASLPRTRDELLSVRGMGEAKYAKFGQRILDVVVTWCNTSRVENTVSSVIDEQPAFEMAGYADLPPITDADVPSEEFYYAPPPEDMKFAYASADTSPEPPIKKQKTKKNASHRRMESSYDAGIRSLGIARKDLPWSAEEDDQMRNEVANGMTLIQIAKAHGRPVFETFSRMKKLGLD